MKKTAYATILILAILFSAKSQVVTLRANPWTNPHPYGWLEITAWSLFEGGFYPKDSVWLNFTVVKPSNWTDYEGQLKYVAYLVDGNNSDLTDSYDLGFGETIIPVEDPLGVVNPPLEFKFSIKLEGLSEGKHYVDIAAVGHVKDGEIETSPRTFYDIYFFVTGKSSPSPTLSPTLDYGLTLSLPQQIAVLSGTIAVACIVLIAFYFKKRQRGQSP